MYTFLTMVLETAVFLADYRVRGVEPPLLTPTELAATLKIAILTAGRAAALLQLSRMPRDAQKTAVVQAVRSRWLQVSPILRRAAVCSLQQFSPGR